MKPTTLVFPSVTQIPILISMILVVLMLASMMLATPVFADTTAFLAQALPGQDGLPASGSDKINDPILKLPRPMVDPSLHRLLGVICYILGLILAMRGLLRIPRHSRGEGINLTVSGTIMSLVVGCVLMAISSQFDHFSQSLFGETSYTSIPAVGTPPVGALTPVGIPTPIGVPIR